MAQFKSLMAEDERKANLEVPNGGLEAIGITKSYWRGIWPCRRELSVLRGADLVVSAGEVIGLVGENGSGKSTLMKILVGALAADGGQVHVSGRIGYCPQEPVLYDRLTCDEHLELFGVAYGMDDQAVAVAADGLYATLGFDRWRTNRVEELSGGTRAKLNLALALLADPDVLRLAVIGAATAVTVAAAVAVSGIWYPPRQWAVFAGANLLIALTYAMVGVLVGPLTGRLGGLYLILLLAFIDVGLGQTVMFPGGPPAWGAFLPGRGSSRVLIDGAFTARFDEVGALLLGLAWLGVLTAAATLVFQRRTGARRR